MCGVFAYTGLCPPDRRILHAAVTAAARRGPHAHGWSGAGIATHHGHGPLPVDRAVDAVSRSPRLIGHARLATVGSHDDLSGAQPITIDGHLVVHNGTIRNARTLDPDSSTDTIAFTRAYASHRSQGLAPDAALDKTLTLCDHLAWAVLILDADGTLLTHRHRLPVYRRIDLAGTYLSSGPFAAAALLAPDVTHLHPRS